MLAKKSHFLLGPRQTGKTTLIKDRLPTAQSYDLLDSSVYLSLSQNPGRLAEGIRPETDLVAIDEYGKRFAELVNAGERYEAFRIWGCQRAA